MLLGGRLEIGSEIESHAAYLGHWIELLKESPTVLFQVFSEARQAADLVCPEADPQRQLRSSPTESVCLPRAVSRSDRSKHMSSLMSINDVSSLKPLRHCTIVLLLLHTKISYVACQFSMLCRGPSRDNGVKMLFKRVEKWQSLINHISS